MSKETVKFFSIFLTLLCILFLVISSDFFQHYPEISARSLNNFGMYVLFPLIMLAIITIFGIGIYIAKHQPKNICNICKKKGTENILKDDGQFLEGRFCRIHLIQEYAKRFIQSPFYKLVCEFKPISSAGTSLFYAPFNEMTKYGWNSQEVAEVQKLLTEIRNKKCELCAKKARSYFVPKERLALKRLNIFSRYPNQSVKFDDPSIERFGQYLCNNHLIEKLIPGVKNYDKTFSNTNEIYLPYRGDGILVPMT